jgi:hypothetical protein
MLLRDLRRYRGHDAGTEVTAGMYNPVEDLCAAVALY